MGVAAQIMRRLLINYARDRAAGKRGSGARREFDLGEIAISDGGEEILAVDMAVTRLAELNAEQSRVVEMRYFGGMSVEETAEAMGISPRTVKRHWALAKAWLRAELSGRGLD
jgi:RNA polymerase sigma factor (TIGR02999 family)